MPPDQHVGGRGGGSGLQSLPRLHGKFEANLGYVHESLSQCGMGWILTTSVSPLPLLVTKPRLPLRLKEKLQSEAQPIMLVLSRVHRASITIEH